MARDISTPVDKGEFSNGDCLSWALAIPVTATSNNVTSDTAMNLGVFKGVLQFLALRVYTFRRAVLAQEI
jgi:hypothetical protein